tara:strand:+ start:21 stop:629 length:609 start_codon:yes stop_codon:yes gene_type:complete
MKKIETFLPLFPGFYGTIFEPYEDSEIEHINDLRNDKGLDDIGYDDCEWNYDDYNERVAERCVDFVEWELKEMELKFTYQGIQSPRFYNYSNDSINVEIELKDMDKIIQYLNENEDEFRQHIKERYTSCSGFISHYSNNSDDWIDDLKSEVTLSHKLGAILEFILINEGVTTMNMYEHCIGECYIYATNFDELTREAENFIE